LLASLEFAPGIPVEGKRFDRCCRWRGISSRFDLKEQALRRRIRRSVRAPRYQR
jgi:hypothetical protein